MILTLRCFCEKCKDTSEMHLLSLICSASSVLCYLQDSIKTSFYELKIEKAAREHVRQNVHVTYTFVDCKH